LFSQHVWHMFGVCLCVNERYFFLFENNSNKNPNQWNHETIKKLNAFPKKNTWLTITRTMDQVEVVKKEVVVN
jgi:hypothetical protein